LLFRPALSLRDSFSATALVNHPAAELNKLEAEKQKSPAASATGLLVSSYCLVSSKST